MPPQISNSEAGLGSFFSGLFEGASDNLQRQYAQQQRDKEHQRMLDEKKSAVKEWQKSVSTGSDMLRSYLAPDSKVSPEEAAIRLGTYDEQNQTKLLPLFGAIRETRKSIPTFTDEKGQEVPNPDYEPDYETRVFHVPDPKNNLVLDRTGRYDPKTHQWELDENGERAYSAEKAAPSRKKDPSGRGYTISAKGQTVINKMMAPAFKSQAHLKYLEDSGGRFAPGTPPNPKDPSIYETPEYQKARTEAGTQFGEMGTYANIAIQGSSDAKEFLAKKMKGVGRGQLPDKTAFWKSAWDEHNKGNLDQQDMILLGLKYTSMYREPPEGIDFDVTVKGTATDPGEDGGGNN